VNVMDQFSLCGKVAIVTGASSGIGKRVALGYAQAGARVVAVSRNADPLDAAVVEVRNQVPGAEVRAFPCDVTNSLSVAALAQSVREVEGKIDVAVCNAGIVTLNGLDEMSLEEFESVQKTNVSGVFLTAQACAREMARQGCGGSIIVTASMSGHVVNTPQRIGHYCVSKAAVIQLAKAMAVEFAPHGIRVNSVSPGYIMTELVVPLTDYHAAWTPRIPLGRLGRPEELMGLYVYLASEASSYMTGADVVIDGGYTCL